MNFLKKKTKTLVTMSLFLEVMKLKPDHFKGVFFLLLAFKSNVSDSESLVWD